MRATHRLETGIAWGEAPVEGAGVDCSTSGAIALVPSPAGGGVVAAARKQGERARCYSAITPVSAATH
jgi:hypothetical protein